MTHDIPTHDTRIRPPASVPGVASVLAAALSCAAALPATPAAAQALPQALTRCVPVAQRTALDAIARTPAIGQMTLFGSPYESGPKTIRVEVDVFGPQSLVYRVDVTVSPDCRVLGETAELESNPWYRR